MTAAGDGRARFFLLLAIAVALGTALRLWMLPGQILLDDEWHGLNQVAGSTLVEVLTDFDAKDNTSLPLNLYHWLLLRTVGWSEAGVRLPVLLAGVLGLILMPLAARRIAGDRASLFFAFLLAISPFAIFYSRFSRAYSIILLLGFLALLEAHRWLTTGERGARRRFAVLGLLAAYAHPLAVVALTVPFIVYYAIASRRARKGPVGSALGVRGKDLVRPSAREVRSAGLTIAGALLPLGWAMAAAKRSLPWGEGEWTLDGMRDAATLLAGTVHPPLAIAFYALAAWGLIVLVGRHPVFVWMAASAAALYAAALTAGSPFGLGTGIVILRYAIVVTPLALLAAAAGFDGLPAGRAGSGGRAGARTRVIAPVAAFAAFATLSFVLGPLPATYAPPNNFTGHSAFQGSYDPPNDEVSEARHVYPGHRIRRAEAPAFYHGLATMPDVRSVIEYPLDVTNYNNVLWFHQRIHRKEVLAGYCAERALLGHRAELPPGSGTAPPRFGLLGADQILSNVPDRSMLRFRNMVDVTDSAAIAASGADFLVLHRYVMALRFLPDGTTTVVPVFYRSVPAIAGACARWFGPPAWESDEIVCFRIGKSYNP